MKILWLCNIPIFQIANSFAIPSPSVGGWLSGAYNKLIACEDIELIYLFPGAEYKKRQINGKVKGISYIEKSPKSYDKALENIFREILNNENPDIIHIWGTEYPRSYSMIKASKSVGLLPRTTVSIQGLVSIYSLHYYAYLPPKVIYGISLRDLLKLDNVFLGKRNFRIRGKYEVEVLKSINHVVGRTEWDYACAKMFNNNIEYYFCNETLRDSFYNDEWSIDKCDRHTIFVSQASYPIKGFHIMIEALKILCDEYRDIKVYVTGSDLNNTSFGTQLKRTYYGNWLSKQIHKSKLGNNIYFLGNLNEADMKNEFLKANVFVCCSSIENSPNSVGEAMILGTPVVCADVGGVKSMLHHEVEGLLYQADAPYMLAHNIKRIFDDDILAKKLSQSARKRALITHDPDINSRRLIEIYHSIRDKEVSPC